MARRYVDLLGRDYREFLKAFRKCRIAEQVPAAAIPAWMKAVKEYAELKNRDVYWAVEHMSRY